MKMNDFLQKIQNASSEELRKLKKRLKEEGNEEKLTLVENEMIRRANEVIYGYGSRW